MNLSFKNNTISGIISFTLFLISYTNLSAQTINFNYASSGLSTSDCNIFDPPLAVQGYTHTAFAGAPTFTGSSIYAPASANSTSNILAGTGYAISYPFTAQHGYAVGVNVTASTTNPNVQLPYFKVGLSSSLPIKNIWCRSGWLPNDVNTSSLSFPTIYNNTLSATNNIHVPSFIGSGQSYLLIGTYPVQTTSTYIASVYIGSISISDVPPITPSSASLQCSGSSQVFSVNTPYHVDWGSSPSGILTTAPSGPNFQNVTATATTNTGYVVTLIATVTTPNGIVTLNRQVAVGVPVTNISSSAGACNNGYQTWSLSATSPSSVTSWQWTKDASATGSWYIYNPSSPNTMVDVSGGGGGISLTTTNACGTGKNGVTIYANCPHAITATPNPTTGNVTIAVAEQKGVTSANEKKAMMYQIKVSDQFGAVKKLYKYSSGTSNSSISLHGLISGTYTIQAFDGTSWSSVQIIKQ